MRSSAGIKTQLSRLVLVAAFWRCLIETERRRQFFSHLWGCPPSSPQAPASLPSVLTQYQLPVEALSSCRTLTPPVGLSSSEISFVFFHSGPTGLHGSESRYVLAAESFKLLSPSRSAGKASLLSSERRGQATPLFLLMPDDTPSRPLFREGLTVCLFRN